MTSGHKSSYFHLVFAVAIVVGGFSIAFGQAAARPNRGTMPTGSYAVSDLETISLTNGNLNIGIPLASLPPVAGGKLGLTLRAVYNSKLWDTVRRERQFDPVDPSTKYVVSNLQLSSNGGWLIGGGYSISFVDAWDDYEWLSPSQTDPEYDLITQNRWTKVVLTTPDGATHELRPADYSAYGDGYLNHSYLRGYYKDNPNKVNGPVRYYSFDGSHLWAKIDPNPFVDPSNPSLGRFYGVAQSWTLYLPDGTKVEQLNGIQTITDTNGNKIKMFWTEASGIYTSHIQDEQTGREIKVVYDPVANGGWGQAQVQYQTVGGVWQTIAINYGSTRVFGKRYEFGEFECADAADYVDTEMTVIRSIVYPPTEPGQPGRQFTFTYNSDTTDTVNYQWRPSCWVPYETVTAASRGWGSLSQITMPSGAIVNYGHGLDGSHYLAFNPDEAPREGVTFKTVTHDGTSETWTYAVNPAAGEFTGPDGSSVTETRYPSDPGFAHTYSGFGGKEELVYRTNSSNKVMVERHWTLMPFSGGENIAAGANVLVAFNPVVDAEYTSLLDDSPAHNPIKMSAKTFQYDYNGNLLQTTEYDWFDPSLVSRDAQGVPTGVPPSATVLRVTSNAYYNQATDSTSANVYAKRSLSSATPLILNALQQTSTGPAIAQFSFDGNSYGVAPTIGNLTSRSVWNDSAGDWITTSSTYDSYGNVASTTDARGKITTFGYLNPALGLPTSVTVDPQNGTGTQTTTTAYDFSTGLVTSTTDPNGNTSTIDYTNQLLGTIDPFGRPGVVYGPDLGSGVNHLTETFYADASRTVTVLSDLNSEGDGLLKSQVISDMLGRTIESRQYETASAFIAVRKTYDIPNRLSKTSNPFRAGEAVVWTTAANDVLGRVISITTPDNAVVTTAYDANFTTVTDQAGKVRRSMVDGLGRLIRVDEPDKDTNALGTTSSPNQPTCYEYDALANLTKVIQGTQLDSVTGRCALDGSQQRTFTYDSLSRLRTALNPESGSVSYQYDDNGNVTQKTDARGVVSNYVYDALNRNTSITYSDGTPSVTRVYDSAANGKGRLYYHHTGSADESQNSLTVVDVYDALGRPKSWYQKFAPGGDWGTPYSMSASYDLAGHLKTMTYPSGRSVTNNFDGAGRLQSFTGNLGDGTLRTYASGISYSSFGGMTQEQFGMQTPLYHKLHYNVRGQLHDIRVSTVAWQTDQWDWNRGAIINYYATADLSCPTNDCRANSGPDNNGNVIQSQHWIPENDQLTPRSYFEDRFTYDALNRLKSVTEYRGTESGLGETPQFAQVYGYDRWGNRTINNGATWGGGINNLAFDTNEAPTTNRLYAPGDTSLPMNQRLMRFDAAGNLTFDNYTGAGTRTYDAENRMTSAQASSPATYVYDADGHRVKRIVNGVETWQVYGIGGELIAEYAANTSHLSPQKEYGYRNGELLITATAGTADWGPPPSYTPPATLVSGLDIKLEHLTELRTAVNQLRSHAGLPNFNFTVDPNPVRNETTVKADHIRQLRQALEGARTQLGLSIGGYEHPTLTENQSWISAIDFQELRNQVASAWQSGGGVDIRWVVADQLGTPRMIFDQTGSLANVSRHDYLPFGEEVPANFRAGIPGYGASDNLRQKFTQKERDIETGLDYFGARYFSSSQGRFTGVDPAPIKKRHLINPQDLNRYAYVANNPLAFIDPDGEEKITVIVRTYIPSQTVGSKPMAVFKGDYNAKGERVSVRTEQRITIETDASRRGANGIVDYGQTIGPTVRLSKGIFSMVGPSEKTASGNTLDKGFERINENTVRVTAKGNEANPMNDAYPGITYNLAVTVSSEGENGKATVNLYGQHDGFPSYEVEIQRPESGGTSTIIYQHDSNKERQTPLSLYGSGDYYPRTQNVVIEPRKKKKDERE